MREKRTYTRSQAYLEKKAAEHRLIEETYADIGEALAAAVVEAGKSEAWAWDMLRLLGDYERWLIKKWISRYRHIHRPRLRWRAEAERRRSRRWAEEEARLRALRDRQNEL